MKLNYKRTLLVGLAFLSISALWQVYDFAVPKMLKYSFNLPDGEAGIIMALDNILALFLLPFFGSLSDKCHTRIGKRIPFILCGTAVVAVCMVLLPIADAQQNLTFFFIVLAALLLGAGLYRSPAVALMPDVTPKPLRSKGNAIINLMGAVGGVFSLLMIQLLAKGGDAGRSNYEAVFATVAVFMVAAVVVLFFTVRENKLVAEMEAIHYGADPEEEKQETVTQGGKEKLTPEVRRSLLLILASVALWFMGYNAVTSAFSKYATEMWHMSDGSAATCLMVATVGAILSYLPVGILSSRIGRKRMIQFGVVLLALCFASGIVFTTFSPALYLIFALIGCAWACINVNSFPMVVEIARGSDIGKYTGFYYTFSMAAQIVTPIVSGYLLQLVGYWTLFPYAAIMVALAFVTISLTKHGDSKPQPPKSKLEAFDTED